MGFTRSLNVSAAVSASLAFATRWREEKLGKAGDLAQTSARRSASAFTSCRSSSGGDLLIGITGSTCCRTSLFNA